MAIAAAYLKRAYRLGTEGAPGARLAPALLRPRDRVRRRVRRRPDRRPGGQAPLGHMIQHLMLADVASLLIVLGFTGPLLQPAHHLRAGRPLRRLTHPVVAITLFTVNLYIWHIPFLYQAVLTDLLAAHVLEHMLFLGTGIPALDAALQAAAQTGVVR